MIVVRPRRPRRPQRRPHVVRPLPRSPCLVPRPHRNVLFCRRAFAAFHSCRFPAAHSVIPAVSPFRRFVICRPSVDRLPSHGSPHHLPRSRSLLPFPVRCLLPMCFPSPDSCVSLFLFCWGCKRTDMKRAMKCHNATMHPPVHARGRGHPLAPLQTLVEMRMKDAGCARGHSPPLCGSRTSCVPPRHAPHHPHRTSHGKPAAPPDQGQADAILSIARTRCRPRISTARRPDRR